jgi:hypothetical protein
MLSISAEGSGLRLGLDDLRVLVAGLVRIRCAAVFRSTFVNGGVRGRTKSEQKEEAPGSKMTRNAGVEVRQVQ